MNVSRKILALICIFASTSTLRAQTPRMEHRFEGLVADSFMSDDGTLIWTCEDGGRVRFRNNGSPWTYLNTPNGVENTIRAIHFVPDPSLGWSNPAILEGWLVGDDAGVWKTIDGGNSWTQVVHGPPDPAPGNSYHSHLRDVHFISGGPSGVGWVLGLHGIWKSNSGGGSLTPALLLDSTGTMPLDISQIELYAIDVLVCGNEDPIIVACGEPGIVLKAEPPTANYGVGEVFKVIWDMRTRPASELNVCGSTNLFDKIQLGRRPEIWDIEFQRKCSGGPPLLIMVAGGEELGGSAFSSTDMGSTFVRECHECDLNPSFCNGNTDYELTSTSPHGHYKRHKVFNHLYGVGVFGDGTAVAGGYNGQHVVRQSNGVWVDRSQQGAWALEVTEEASFMFLNGASCQRNAGSSASNGKAFLVGQGGQGRSTTAAISTTPVPLNPPTEPQENWKEDWTAGRQSGWWRMHATAFNTSDRGWRTGQNYHVARTINGGLSWDLEDVLPFGYNFSFHSTAISPAANESQGSGVAVGQPDNRDLSMLPYGCTTKFLNQPKILRRVLTLSGIMWVEPTSIDWLSSFGAPGRELRDVAWAGGADPSSVYWACGTGDTVLRSTTSGDTWTQYGYPSGSAVCDFNALAFVDAGRGFVVGRNNSTGQACAYGVDVAGAPASKDISPEGVIELFDVAYHAATSTAYAVGSIDNGSQVVGAVFSSILDPGGFTVFAEIPGPIAGGVLPCTIGDFLGEPRLSSVAVATNGDLWVGGECGRVWRRNNSTGTWESIKSQTDGHVLDMASAPGGYVYVTSMRTNLTGPGLVRWRP